MIDLLLPKRRRAPASDPTADAEQLPASPDHAARIAALTAEREALVTRCDRLAEQAAGMRAAEQAADRRRTELLLAGEEVEAERATDAIVRLRSQIDGLVNASRAIASAIGELDVQLHATTIAMQRDEAEHALRAAVLAFETDQLAFVRGLRQLAAEQVARFARLEALSRAGAEATVRAHALGLEAPHWDGNVLRDRVDLLAVGALASYHEALAHTHLSSR